MRGYDASLVVFGSGADIGHGAPTPRDVSMDSSAAERDLTLKLTPFKVAVKKVFA